MRNRKKIRDMIYVSRPNSLNCFYSYGIEFHEFMNCMDKRPENLLLLKHHFDSAQWNMHSRFDYVTEQEIEELMEDNIYGYGDFCWVDFSKESDLDALSAADIAELLYFAHLAKPLHAIPKERFAYFAHDDGWFNKLYVTDLNDYKILLAKIIVSKHKRLTGKQMNDIPMDIASMLLEYTGGGLIIDLARITMGTKEIAIPLSQIGHYTDMDHVCEMRAEISDYKAWLVYSNKSWKLIKTD
ncbi:hypothetical protein [Paenibacillus glycanilyticus]|uniref:hypothetical protein n=1 Tax=Paenibacillus glycanilyticus TaxID=126569 RepID=UPI003EBFEEBD